MKKNRFSIILAITLSLVICFPIFTLAAAGNGTIQYSPLAPIPALGLTTTMTIGADNSLVVYFNSIVKIMIALATGLAVLYIVYGGVQYSLTDSFEKKGAGKATIIRALQGLLLALTSWLILNTINPLLLTGKINGLVDESAPPTTEGSAAITALPDGSNPAAGGNGATAAGANGATPDAAAEQALAGQLSQQGILATPVSGGFPNADWNAYALQQVQESGLMNLSPSDAAKFFPSGQPTAQGWVDLLSGMAKAESDYNPNDVTYEPSQKHNSVGLLSLSASDAAAQNLGYSEQDLKDPYKNIQAGVMTLASQVQNAGVISGQSSTGKWIGASAYWSTLRTK